MAIKHKTSILSSAKRIVYTHLVGSLNTAGVLQYPVAVITQHMFLYCQTVWQIIFICPLTGSNCKDTPRIDPPFSHSCFVFIFLFLEIT